MRNSLILIIGSLLTLGLVACGGGGGGSSSTSPVVGAAGNTTPGNVGQGTWSGVLQGNGSQQYMMMAGQLGGGYSPNLDLQITTYNGGQLPGQVGVTLGYNYQFYAQAYVSGNAFIATYTPGYNGGGGYYGQQQYGQQYGQQCVPGYACQPGVAQPTGTALLQINTQFADPCTRQIMSVTVYYQGVAVASGQLTSTSAIQSYGTYNPSCPNQGYYPGQSVPGQSYYPGQTYYPGQQQYPGQTTYYYQQPYTNYIVR